MGPTGEVQTPLAEDEVAAAARELAAAGVSSIVIGFLNSYRNPAHEERAREIVEGLCPEAFVTTSASVFPQFREYERFTTAAINGFVGLHVRRYLDRLFRFVCPRVGYQEQDAEEVTQETFLSAVRLASSGSEASPLAFRRRARSPLRGRPSGQ